MAKKKKRSNRSAQNQEQAAPTKRMTLKEKLKLWFFLAWIGFLFMILIGFMVLKEFNLQGRKVEGRNLAVQETVDGATLEFWDQERLAREEKRIAWCMDTLDGSHVGESGSMSGSAANDSFRLLCDGYGPDVYPAHERNSGKSWEPRDPDRGGEWVVAQWRERTSSPQSPNPVKAKGIVIVETFNPGAVMAVDAIDNYHAEDGNKTVQGAMKKTRLWSGKMDPAGESRIAVLRLNKPTSISVLRLVLDTRQVPGYNSLDTVGLLY